MAYDALPLQLADSLVPGMDHPNKDPPCRGSSKGSGGRIHMDIRRMNKPTVDFRKFDTFVDRTCTDTKIPSPFSIYLKQDY